MSPASAQHEPLPHEAGASGLGLALRRLPVAARALYVTAHPDDEHNGVLVALSRGRGAATALLTLTRGEGGQNAIGPELFEALGVLRTEELAAVHRYDGARQYFGQAFDFGFSVSLEESLARWGRDAALGDIVRVVRSFRPDVILTLPAQAPGHQHHTAVGLLVREAFRAAADPARFPEQLEQGLRPWQARSLYQGGAGTGGESGRTGADAVQPLGALDELLGMSWAEFGSLARSFHRSQATRQLRLAPGELGDARFELVDAEPRALSPGGDLFDGIDTSLLGLARFAPEAGRVPVARGLFAVQACAEQARDLFDARRAANVLPPLRDGLRRLRELRGRSPGTGATPGEPELEDRLAETQAAFESALALAHGLAFLVESDDGEVTAGQAFQVTTLVSNQGSAPLRVDEIALELPEGWTSRLVAGSAGELPAGSGAKQVHEVVVGATPRLSRPYWRRPPGADRYEVGTAGDRGLPWSAPPVRASLRYSSEGTRARWEQPAVFRYPGRWVGGEKRKTVAVVPDLSVGLVPRLAVFPVSGARPATRELRVTVLNNRKGPSEARVSLAAPAGWRSDPPEAELRIEAEGAEATVRFQVTPPAGLAEGTATIRAEARSGGRTFSEGYQVVAYDHIEERNIYSEASAVARLLDVRVARDARIGYVMGTGDAVPAAIAQLGLPLTLLSADDLAFADLTRHSTIMLGVRAYQARPDLRASQLRLMEYVRRGGHLVVQYHQGPEFNGVGEAPSPYAPFPARVGSGRVTDEAAPVQALLPEAAVLSVPNRIAERDWKGWVQERGLQLLEARDARYRDLLAAADPFPENAGVRKGLLVEAKLGKGTWTYVGLGLFRQLPAGTPGAYRLLANLLGRVPG